MAGLLRWLQNWWNSLTPGAQDQVVGGLIVTAIAAVGSGLWALLRWVVRRPSQVPTPPPAQPMPPQPITVRVEAPPTPSPPAERHVPRPPSKVPQFIARHDEEGRDVVQRVTKRLCQDCLVTIWGHGGVGKTTLALEVAHGMLPDLGGGVIWTSADGRPAFDLPFLLDEVCTRLGQEDARSFPLERKSAVARTLLGERDCLLAVDNFETVADPQQEAIAAFLNDVPYPVLVTSRERLTRGKNVRVGPMTPQEAREFLASLVERSTERLKPIPVNECTFSDNHDNVGMVQNRLTL